MNHSSVLAETGFLYHIHLKLKIENILSDPSNYGRNKNTTICKYMRALPSQRINTQLSKSTKTFQTLSLKV